MPTNPGTRRKPPSKKRVKAERERLGGWLREVREDRGLTQQQVGDAIGCFPSNVSMFEYGQHSPSLPKLRAMAKLYRCTLDELTTVGGLLLGDVSTAHKR